MATPLCLICNKRPSVVVEAEGVTLAAFCIECARRVLAEAEASHVEDVAQEKNGGAH